MPTLSLTWFDAALEHGPVLVDTSVSTRRLWSMCNFGDSYQMWIRFSFPLTLRKAWC